MDRPPTARRTPANRPPTRQEDNLDRPLRIWARSAAFGEPSQKLGGRLDWDLAPPPKAEQVAIPRNDGSSLAGCRRFQNPIVGRVSGNLGNSRGRLNKGGDPGELAYGFLNSCRLPAELRLQYRSQFSQQGPRGDQLDAFFENQAIDEFRAPAGEDESRYQDVGIEDDPQPPRASWISRSTSLSSLTPKARAREAP